MAEGEHSTDETALPARETTASTGEMMWDPRAMVPVWIIAVLMICHGLYFARTLVAPIVVSLLLYLTLRPLVVRMERFRLPHHGSALILLVAFIGMMIVSVATVITPARGWLSDLPMHLDTFRQGRGAPNPFQAIEDASEKVESIASDEESEAEKPVEVQVQQPQWTSQWYLVNGTTAFVGFMVITVVLTFFLLATGDALINNLLHVLPSFGERRRAVELILELQGGISSYLGQVTLINVGLGVAVAIAMALIGMPSPLLWGTMATLLNFIPFFRGAAWGRRDLLGRRDQLRASFLGVHHHRGLSHSDDRGGKLHHSHAARQNLAAEPGDGPALARVLGMDVGVGGDFRRRSLADRRPARF